MGQGVLRAARGDERFAVLALCRAFHAASGIPFAFDAAHASRSVQDYIEDPRKLCLVREVDGALRGVLAAATSISPLAPVRIAQELVFWVDPQHRGRGSRDLLTAYEAWARAEGCAAAGLSNLNDPRVARFFAGAGFALCEQKSLKILD